MRYHERKEDSEEYIGSRLLSGLFPSLSNFISLVRSIFPGTGHGGGYSYSLYLHAGRQWTETDYLDMRIAMIEVWAEVRQWAGGQTSKTKYRMPKSQKPDGAVADSTKRLASRYYQLKTGHARTGQYLHWAKVRPDAQCWWCKCPSQTRDHLFKVCPEWKVQQKILWAEVLKETKRWKSRWAVRDLLADRRCGRAVLDFLSSTDVGRMVPPREGKGDAGSEVSEWELRERQERQEEQEEEAEALGAEDGMDAEERLPLFRRHPLSWHRQAKTRGTGRSFFPL